MKKNILIIQRDLGGGGAEKVLIDILNNIDYKKYNITLQLIYKTGVYIDSINKNVNVFSIYDPKKYKNRIIQSIYCRFNTFLYEKYPKVLYKLFIDKGYDVEIAFLEGETTKLLYNSSNKSSKKVAWVHIDMNSHDKSLLEKEKKYYERIDEVICVSNDCKKTFDNCFPKYKRKSKTLYNLIDVKKICNLAKEDVAFDSTIPCIIGVGRLTRQKRFDLLIRAHKLLIDEGIKNKLIILGDGESRGDLINLIKKLKVEKSVELVGFKKNPYPYIKKSDIFVMSSDYEGFSLVVAEAIALGKPIVSTRCVGPEEILNGGEYGQIVECGNQNELKEAIKKLLKDDKLKEYYQQKSQERRNSFNIENIMKQIYEIFET